jgi:hypothetical protein
MSLDGPEAKRGSTPTSRKPKPLPTRRNHFFLPLCLRAAPSFRWTRLRVKTRYASFGAARRRSQRGAPCRPFHLPSSPTSILISTWSVWKELLTLRDSNRLTVGPSRAPRSTRQARADSARTAEHTHLPRLLPRNPTMAVPCLVTRLDRVRPACVAARAMSTFAGCHHIPSRLLCYLALQAHKKAWLRGRHHLAGSLANSLSQTCLARKMKRLRRASARHAGARR